MNRAPRRVLITRPRAQSAGLEAALRARGLEPTSLPLFEIQAQADTEAHRATLDRARAWNGWLFTSANAARAAAQLDLGLWPTLYAIGEATAGVLAELGRPGARRAANGSTSEDLLGHPALQSVRGQQFLICTGAGGRTALEQELRARGARVERLELYRRVAIAHAPDAVRAAITRCEALICTSGESLERLLALTPADARAALHARSLVVPSARVLELARRLGWSSVRAPASTSDEALVDCLVAA